jgi:8-oxo-dGTP pyrophosphatase MutT (NUDIX family)
LTTVILTLDRQALIVSRPAPPMLNKTNTALQSFLRLIDGICVYANINASARPKSLPGQSRITWTALVKSGSRLLSALFDLAVVSGCPHQFLIGRYAVRQRRAARLLITDALGRVLLFHFEHQAGALAGMRYWATPGGGVEGDETFEEAAIRELWEETGIRVDDVGCGIGQRQVVFQLSDGEYVNEDERYFHVRVSSNQVSTLGWTAYEMECMTGHRWWTQDELEQAVEKISPENLAGMLRTLGIQCRAV